jgi:hypothetical protein
MVKTNINVSNLSIKILHWTISSLAYHQTLNARVFFSTIQQIDDPNDKFEIIAGLKISTFHEDENLKRKIEVIAGCPNFAAVAAVLASAKDELEELLLPDAALESSEYEAERRSGTRLLTEALYRYYTTISFVLLATSRVSRVLQSPFVGAR